jgi:formyltetrahydrofolate hydrolase
MSDLSADFRKIRRELDPAFCYLVLERKGSPGIMAELVDLLYRLGIPILETKVHENTLDRRFFLVAKLEPKEAKEISREYVSINLPENVSCLFYGSLVREGGEMKKDAL